MGVTTATAFTTEGTEDGGVEETATGITRRREEEENV